jgi:UDP-N-acetylmuramate dehydrogenase
VKTLLKTHGISFQENTPFAKKGYWRIGGSLRYLALPETVTQLSALQKEAERTLILGNGSNLLMADQGFSGVAIQLKGELADIQEQGDRWIVGAGVRNVVLLSRLKKAERRGLGSLAGVPGLLGGAIRMNAGTYLGEIGEQVEWVEWVDQRGILQHWDSEQLEFRYRRVNLPWTAMITRVCLRTTTENWKEETESIQKHLLRRKQTQPLNLPSCGSVFKNPEGDYAGRLIESLDLKGHRIGGAEISEKHANFIVNTDQASAMDVYQLIRLARQKVYKETGFVLEPEVRPEGDWDKNLWPIDLD